jgi:hypothetical protein
MLWPAPEDALLRQVIADHGSASEAAIALGAAGYDRSRCACIGYARRQTALGKDGYRWQSHTVERPHRRSQGTSKPPRAAQATVKSERAVTAEQRSAAFEGAGKFSFLEVSRDLCAWPVGSPAMACGEPVAPTGRAKVYCERHARLAYRC